jgi:hypothetical protein
MKCPICHTEQNLDSNYCNKCGFNLDKYKEQPPFQVKPKSYRTLKVVIGIVIVVLVVFALVNNRSNRNSSSSAKLTLNSDQINNLEDLQRQGLILIEPQLNRTYIDPFLWAGMDAKLKENFSASLAIYCGNKKGTELYWVEIYDKQSGKKLAKYSHSWGFDIY